MIETLEEADGVPTLGGVLAALADDSRRAIARRLWREGPLSCATAIDGLGLTASAASYHFKTLREAGLTTTTKQGTYRIIALRADLMERRYPGLLSAILGAVGAADTLMG
ncbi:ArsR/SmtB family transcription factor [Streptomyces sp. NPDC050485]|uniref:ArsR/SmtB family transcription factor n=1 Tax=Streptomyces sp. NPDC050485 TaxID=3365617 RepID=UPI0037926D08